MEENIIKLIFNNIIINIIMNKIFFLGELKLNYIAKNYGFNIEE